MKQNLPALWWLVSALLIALVFGAMGYAYDQAILLALLFLPGLLILRYFVPQLTPGKQPKVLLNALLNAFILSGSPADSQERSPLFCYAREE